MGDVLKLTPGEPVEVVRREPKLLEVVADGEVVGKEIVNFSAAELGRVKEMKTSQVQEFPPRADEAVHRDRFVLT